MNDRAATDGWRIGDLRRDSSERPGAVRVERMLAASAPGHVLFVPRPTGYEIVEAVGPPPRSGERVEVGGREYLAAGTRRSPFPGDTRPCVVLEG